MNKLSIGVVLLIVVGFISCKTDIDVNAEPTDITVVYGLIDPVDTVHYIKINKAFLGEGSALDLASDASNYDYADGDLSITVEEQDENGNVLKMFSTGAGTLLRVTNEVPKDAGIFDTSTNVLYKFIEPSINRDKTYTLTIVNKKLDNKEITTETKIVAHSGVSSPRVTNNLAFWSGPVDNSGNALTQKVVITVGENIGRIQAFIVFNYMEYYTLASGNIPVAKKVVMNLGENKTTDASNGNLNFSLDGQNFLDNITASVPANSTIPFFSHRELDNISIEYSAAGTELSTFMEAEAPSTTVNQDKPSYTNIINGIGIFSSRTRDASWESVKTPSTSLNIDSDTKRKLASLGLGFCLGTHATATSPCPF